MEAFCTAERYPNPPGCRLPTSSGRTEGADFKSDAKNRLLPCYTDLSSADPVLNAIERVKFGQLHLRGKCHNRNF